MALLRQGKGASGGCARKWKCWQGKKRLARVRPEVEIQSSTLNAVKKERPDAAAVSIPDKCSGN
eukprot:scaffold28879_cov31-Tisochrysis_lutea.AAC.3